MSNVTYEHYSNIDVLLYNLEKRSPTGNGDSDVKKSVHKSFHGVDSYDEALQLFKAGLPSVCKDLKQTSLTLDGANANDIGAINKRMRRNYYNGYAPNIGRALLGLPKDMMQIKRVKTPVKTISLLYNNSTNGGTESEDIMKSGKTVFTLAYALEKLGYKVNIDLLVYAAERNWDFALCIVTLKEFKQAFDLLKLSFPLTHTSAFRVFGFRWLETVPGLNQKWFGNGSQMSKKDIKRELDKQHYNDKAYIITIKDCMSANFDYVALSKAIGLSL